MLDDSVRADLVQPARSFYLRWLIGWVPVLLLACVPVVLAGFLVHHVAVQQSIRSHGPVVPAEVVWGTPGVDDKQTVQIGDRLMNVDVTSWRDTARRPDGRLDVVVDPAHPGNPDDPAGAFGDSYYGTAVLASEPFAIPKTLGYLGALLLWTAGILLSYGALAPPPFAARRVLADRWGTPGQIVAQGDRPMLPPWRWTALLAGRTPSRRRCARGVVVRTEHGTILLPLLTRRGLRTVDPWSAGAEVLLVGDASVGGRPVIVRVDKGKAWTPRVAFCYRKARAADVAS